MTFFSWASLAAILFFLAYRWINGDPRALPFGWKKEIAEYEYDEYDKRVVYYVNYRIRKKTKTKPRNKFMFPQHWVVLILLLIAFILFTPAITHFLIAQLKDALQPFE